MAPETATTRNLSVGELHPELLTGKKLSVSMSQLGGGGVHIDYYQEDTPEYRKSGNPAVSVYLSPDQGGYLLKNGVVQKVIVLNRLLEELNVEQGKKFDLRQLNDMKGSELTPTMLRLLAEDAQLPPEAQLFRHPKG